jgi:plasmid stabilization system protein ParE
MNNSAYNVKWTKPAQKDLNNIIDFIMKDGFDRANQIYERIILKVDDLQFMPNKGRIVPELELLNINMYREIIDNPWRIFYKIDKTDIFILAVIDGRRNVEDIIFDRLITKDFS